MTQHSKQRNVAIYIFNEVEVLDFCGPFEVFSVAGRREGGEPFHVYTVAERPGPVLARNSLSVNPDYMFEDCPASDIVVIPGGGGFDAEGKPFGSRREMENERVLEWVKTVSEEAEIVLSVCTGALILGKAGLLDGLAATTHHHAFDTLREAAPNATIKTDERVVDNGKFVLSGGISAGIDASFHVVARLLGESVAQGTAEYMEYDWQPEARKVGSEQ